MKPVAASLSAKAGLAALFDQCRGPSNNTQWACAALATEEVRLQRALRGVAVGLLRAGNTGPCSEVLPDEAPGLVTNQAGPMRRLLQVAGLPAQPLGPWLRAAGGLIE
jgi:hypothetical protein